MDDDEEVVLKNTGLYAHLKDAGFVDFETIEATKSGRHYENLTSFAVKQSKKECHPEEELEEIGKLVNLFLGSSLVFKDDVEFVKNFLIDLKLRSSKTSFLRSKLFPVSWQTVAVTTICFIGVRYGVKWKPHMLYAIHILPLGFHYLQFLHFKYRIHKRENDAKILIRDLKDLSLLIQKCIQFIQEHEVMTFFNLTTSEKIVKNVGAEGQLTHLRETIFWIIRSLILEFKSQIISLIENFRLNAVVNELSYHLAFLGEDKLHCCDTNDYLSIKHLQKMKYVFLLLQSEFFRQLCLCLIPSLRAPKDKVFVSKILDFLFSLRRKCSDLRSELKTVFEFYYIYEKSDNANQSIVVENWLYKEAYLKLNSVSLSLQNVLRHSRNLEEVLENIRSQESKYDEVVKILEFKSEEIRKHYDRCKPAIDDFCRYVTNLKPKVTSQAMSSASTSTTSTVINKTNILLGISDFEPHWPDEVFVALSESKATETYAADVEDFFNNPASKLLVNELKLALQDKAKEWKERERIALKNKNIEEDFEESNSDNRSLCGAESEMLSQEEKFVDVPKIPLPLDIQSRSSFAEQVATTSASWGLQSEELFCDSDSEKSSTSD